MKTVFFTWITDDFKNTIIDFDGFYKSFKYFHPDVDLVVFDDVDIKNLYAEKPWLYSDNCKGSFAKLLYNDYDLVVNIDSDFYFFDRLHEILAGDYDVAASANFNAICNAEMIPREVNGYNLPFVHQINYIQAGLVASTNKEFWDEYETASKDLARLLPLRDNDVLNMIWYSGKYKTKVLDGAVDFRKPEFKRYYNCASIGRERFAQLKDNKVYLDDKQMASYHVAFGNNGAGGVPKRRMNQIFNPEICQWFNDIIGTVHE